MPHTFACPLYMHNTKKTCFVRLRGCLYATIHLDTLYVWMPPCLDGPLYVWTPPIFALFHMFGCSLCLDTPLYGWMPHMFGHPPVCLDALHMFGCPTVCLDAAKCMVASKGMRDIQTYGRCLNIQGHPNVWEVYGYPQSGKACFLCVVYVQQASKHLANIHGGIQTYGSVHTCSGGIET